MNKLLIQEIVHKILQQKPNTENLVVFFDAIIFVMVKPLEKF